MEQTKLIIKSVAVGIRDSAWGIVKLFQLAKPSVTEKCKPQQKSSSSLNRSARKKKSEEESKFLWHILWCFGLNGVVFWCSIELFNRFVVPGFQSMIEYTLDSGSTANFIWSWLSPCLKLLFSCAWEVPMFFISKIINCLLFQDIAEFAFRQGGGRRSHISSISKFVADFFFSIIVQTFF
uniref:Uncharacterized protein n=1 Tax=Strigamia maritima TaxID=126957 RepID=T1ITI5_STRMM